MNRIGKLSVTLAAALLASTLGTARAASVKVGWDANSEADMSGYRVFHATFSLLSAATAQAMTDGRVGKVAVSSSVTTATLSLPAGATHYIRLAAFDLSGEQSGFNVDAAGADVQLSTFIPSAPVDGAPPVISAVAATGVSSSAASIGWTTDEPSDTQVAYGTTTALGSLTTLKTPLVTAHSQALSGLLPASTYYFKVRSRDAAGNLAIGSLAQFVTPPGGGDAVPPVIGSVAATGISTVSATIGWTTDEPATSQVAYGTTAALGSLTPLDSALVGDHAQALTGLQPSTTYYFRVRSVDAAGNLAVSELAEFATLGAIDDVPPVFSNVRITKVGLSSATVAWATNEPSDTQVAFGTTTALGRVSTFKPALVKDHSAALSGLAAGSVYYYRVRSKDAAGNLAVSGEFTFTTAGGDTTAPAVSLTAPVEGSLASGVVTIAATASDEVGVAGVQFKLDGADLGAEDTSAPYELAWDTKLASDGTAVLTATARDAAGNTTTSAGVSVVVDNEAPSTTLTAPVSGAKLAGLATLSATALDESGVAAVRFLLDGAPLGAELSSAPYSLSWDTTAAADGPHELKAVARDAAGNESVSDPANVTVDNTAPALSGVAASASSAAATVSWTTDEPADGRVEFGTSTAYGRSTPLDAALVTAHAAPLSGLSPSTTYHFRVLSKDAVGNLAAGSDQTFTTLPGPDLTPPVISDVVESKIHESSATVSWKTDEPSDTQVEYGTSTAYGSLTALAGGMVKNHSRILKPLAVGTVYHYRVRSRDAAGNLAVSGDFTFTTRDDQAPVVSVTSPAAGALLAGAANLAAAATDNGSVAGVRFLLDGAPIGAELLAAPYELSWDTKLAADGAHELRAAARDAAGNVSTSAAVTVAVDNAAPGLTGVAAVVLGSSTVRIDWTTDEPADSRVEFGPTSALGSSAGGAELVTAHSVLLSGLLGSTTYHYRVSSMDAAGNRAVGVGKRFHTEASAETVPPVVSAVAVSNVSRASATISWLTDELADSVVQYGLTADYGLVESKTAFVAEHQVRLGGLLAETTYHFRVVSTDKAGNSTASADHVFRTRRARTALTVLSGPGEEEGKLPSDRKELAGYQPGGLSLVRVLVEEGESPVTKVELRRSLVGEEALDRSAAMKLVAPGVYAGILDTRAESKRSGALRWKVEAVDEASVRVETSTRAAAFSPEVLVRPSGGSFRAEDGNPMDGESELRMFHDQGIPALTFNRLDTSDPRLASRGEKHIADGAGMAPAAGFEVEQPGLKSVAFNRPVQLTLLYSDLDGADADGDGVPDGDGIVDGTSTREKDLRMFWHDGIGWRLLGGAVDPKKNTVTAQVTHLSTFGLFPAAAGVESLEDGRAEERFLSPSILDGINDNATFALSATEVTILDVNGRQIARLQQQAGSAISWNARDTSGRVVAAGVYIAKIKTNTGKTTFQSFAVVK